jgi:hypothetical protein
MATVTWTGALSSEYEDVHNWAAGLVPGNGGDRFDTVIFGTATTMAAAVFASGEVGTWQFTGGGYTNAFVGCTFAFLGYGVQVSGGGETIELLDAQIEFFGAADGGTAAYVLDPHSTITMGGIVVGGPDPIQNGHLGSLAGGTPPPSIS